MRLSAADWCFYSERYAPKDYYRALRSMGIDAVEMVAPERQPIARVAGLTLLNISGPGMSEGLNDPANHAKLLPQIREMVAQAQVDGVAQIILFSGNRAGRSDADGAARCIDALRLLAPVAESSGVMLLFEVLNQYDHADYQADHTAFGVEVVAGVASPAVRLLYDIYHMQRQGEDVAKDLLNYAALIGHIHIAQSPRRTAPDDGAPIDYSAILPPLLAAGYSGYLGLEYLPQGDALTELARVCDYFKSRVQ
jgi:hydroxypyruvate isomerase